MAKIIQLFQEKWGGLGRPGSRGQLYGNDSASPRSCPVLAEGGEPAPLAGGEAEKKRLGPGR